MIQALVFLLLCGLVVGVMTVWWAYDSGLISLRRRCDICGDVLQVTMVRARLLREVNPTSEDKVRVCDPCRMDHWVGASYGRKP